MTLPSRHRAREAGTRGDCVITHGSHGPSLRLAISHRISQPASTSRQLFLALSWLGGSGAPHRRTCMEASRPHGSSGLHPFLHHTKAGCRWIRVTVRLSGVIPPFARPLPPLASALLLPGYVSRPIAAPPHCCSSRRERRRPRRRDRSNHAARHPA